ncbi:MAG TPA: DUF2625 domain-containing protein [Candidatus Acidoferrum sp.]
MCPLRPLHELLEVDDPAWPEVESWVEKAANSVEVLPPENAQRSQALLEAQVTTRSAIGAIVYHTGGFLIDKGWLRLLGSGHPRLPRSMPAWNRGRSTTPDGASLGFWLIADDVVGGFFALDSGAFGPGKGEVHYFAPETLRWESMNGMNYSQFLNWSLSPNLGKFYQSLRWDGWENEVSALDGDQALSIYPFLFTKEGKNIANCSRKACPVSEIFSLNVIELPKQLESGTE